MLWLIGLVAYFFICQITVEKGVIPSFFKSCGLAKLIIISLVCVAISVFISIFVGNYLPAIGTTIWFSCLIGARYRNYLENI